MIVDPLVVPFAYAANPIEAVDKMHHMKDKLRLDKLLMVLH